MEKKVNMSVAEKSKIIAEFMGYQYFPVEEGMLHLKAGWWPKGTKDERRDKNYIPLYRDAFNGRLCRRHDQLRYYNEWEWIMPVVEKIEATRDIHHGYFGVSIMGNRCSIQGTNFRSDKIPKDPIYFNDVYGDTKLEATFEAVYQFIIWKRKLI